MDAMTKAAGDAIEALWGHHDRDWQDCNCIQLIRAWRDAAGLNGAVGEIVNESNV